MKTIIITGTPGTGKTTLSKNLAKKLNLYYIDVNRAISENNLYEGYDEKRNTKIVDTNKLNKFLINFIDKFKKNTNNEKYNKKNPLKNIKKLNKSKGIIIDSHLSHYLPGKYADFCIITKCNIKELSKRLKRKKFNRNKLQENLQAEIFDICYNEALERKHHVIVVDTTKGFNIGTVVKRLGG